jgi:hypothetical protein
MVAFLMLHRWCVRVQVKWNQIYGHYISIRTPEPNPRMERSLWRRVEMVRLGKSVKDLRIH